MEYRTSLSTSNFTEFKSELTTKVSTHHTIDQEKTKISELINTVLQHHRYQSQIK